MLLDGIILIVVLTTFLVNLTAQSKAMFSCNKDICYYVRHSFKDELLFGTNITKSTRMIISDSSVDYVRYFGGKIKMLQNDDYFIFYNCPSHQIVSFFYRSNLTSITSQPKKSIDFRYGHTVRHPENVLFQECLEKYCDLYRYDKLHTWRFVCENDNIRYFNLRINRTISNLCLESIKYAFLNSSNLIDLNTSLFFKYAINVINLTIVAPKNIPAIKCDLFGDIADLRLLRLLNVDLHSTYCIFQFNRQLIQISNRSDRLWNMCNGTFDLVNDENENNNMMTSSSNFWNTFSWIIISCLPVVIVLILRKKYCKRDKQLTTSISVI